MTTIEFVDLIRAEFTAELERTGAYTKPGMLLAFERAVSRATLKLLEHRPESEP